MDIPYPSAFKAWAIATIAIGMAVQVVYASVAIGWVVRTLWKEAMKDTTHDPR